MKRTRLTALPLLSASLLLAACNPGGTPDDDVPTVARPAKVGSSGPCLLSTPLLNQLGGLEKLRGTNFLPSRLGAQTVTPSVYDLLLGMRTAINTNYWGVSTVNLQALHEQYEGTFRSTFGNLRDAALQGSVDALMNEYVDAIHDGHTYYLDPLAMQAVNSGRTGGTTATPRYGIQYAPVPQEDGAVLLDVTLGSPAAQAGLQRGDTILSVNGTALARTGDDAASRAAYSQVLGSAAQAGTAVLLVVRRGTQNLTVTVTPAPISSNEEPFGKMLNATTYWLRVPSFDAISASAGAPYRSVTAQKTHDLIHAAQAQGAQNIIVDLRDNPGGLLMEVVAVAGAFNQSVSGMTLETLEGDVSFAYRAGQVYAGENCTTTVPMALKVNSPATWTGKTVFLVNAESASGGEIVPQMLQLAGLPVYGEATYGVANTTTVFADLPGQRGVAVTFSVSRNAKGQLFSAKTSPNVTVADDLRALAHGTDTVLQAALNSLK